MVCVACVVVGGWWGDRPSAGWLAVVAGVFVFRKYSSKNTVLFRTLQYVFLEKVTNATVCERDYATDKAANAIGERQDATRV